MSERTSYSYCWWIREFLQWLKSGDIRLGQISLGTVNEFMGHLASRGLSRVTRATVAKVLRRFLR